MYKHRAWNVTLAIAVACTCLSALVQSEPYPNKPVRILVGAVAGGTTDLMSRLVTKEFTPLFEQSFVVDDRAGASGIIAANIMAKSPPDGYTLLMVGSAHSKIPALYPDVPYDTHKDLACIGLVANTPYVLVVHPSLPVKNVAELIVYLKKTPGAVYASPGQGTGQHLSAELFKKMAGVSMSDIHYKGSGALRTDLLSGRVPIAFDNVSLMLPYLAHGTLRALAISAGQRSSLLPDVPTVNESGLPGFEVLGWFALLAPAKTPKGRIQIFNRALNEVLARPSLKNSLATSGATPMGGTPKQCDNFIFAEVDKWSKVIKEVGIKLK